MDIKEDPAGCPNCDGRVFFRKSTYFNKKVYYKVCNKCGWYRVYRKDKWVEQCFGSREDEDEFYDDIEPDIIADKDSRKEGSGGSGQTGDDRSGNAGSRGSPRKGGGNSGKSKSGQGKKRYQGRKHNQKKRGNRNGNSSAGQ